MAHDPHIDLAALLACDVRSLGPADTITNLGRVRRLRGFLDRTEADLTNHSNELYQQGRGAPGSDVLSRNQNVSAAEGRRRERRAKALAKTKQFGDALAEGKVSAEHADALANATARLDDELSLQFFGLEAELLAKATASSPEQFSRHCHQVVGKLERDQGLARAEQQRRDARVTRKIANDGMYHLHGVFHPELGARVWNALDREVASLLSGSDDRQVDRSHVASEALGNLVTGGHQAVRPSEADLLVIADLRTVVHGSHADSVCETDHGVPLPPETVRRLCCNGRITPIILGVDGVPLNLGRTQRLASRAQRRALRAMYRNCGFGRCDVPFGRCEIHHVFPFELGGNTDLLNLIPLCARHHHLVHELGWKLDLAPDRRLTIRQPDGSVFSVESIQIRPTSRSALDVHDTCRRARQRVLALRRC
ncbi:MAG TPA: DUF222 domain-containing protein [Ilumatobacter sp.]|nr:DUF222 domain-containing protein [Ilumatobacter sp.]